MLTDFTVSVFPRSKKTTAKEIANIYKNALKAEGAERGKTGGA